MTKGLDIYLLSLFASVGFGYGSTRTGKAMSVSDLGDHGHALPYSSIPLLVYL